MRLKFEHLNLFAISSHKPNFLTVDPQCISKHAYVFMFQICMKHKGQEQESLNQHVWADEEKKAPHTKTLKISRTKSTEKVVTELFMTFDGQVVRLKCNLHPPQEEEVVFIVTHAITE